MDNETPSSVPQVNESVKSAPHFNKKLVIASFIILAFLVAIGVSAYKSGYFMPIEGVTNDSLKASREAKSGSFEVHTTIDISGVKESEKLEDISSMFKGKILTMNMAGSYDQFNKDNPLLDGMFSFEFDTIKAAIDMKIVDKTLYLRLTEGPNLGFISLAPFENKWVYFNESDLTKGQDETFSSLSPSLFGYTDDSERQEINTMVDNAHLITITKKHSPETVDGILSFHFDFDIDKAGIISYLKQVAEYANRKSGDKEEVFTPDVEAELEKALGSISNFKGEGWIGISDRLPRKFDISFDLMDPEKPEDGSAKVKTLVTYKNWNKPVSVEAPKDAMTLDKLMSSVMGGGVGMDMMGESAIR